MNGRPVVRRRNLGRTPPPFERGESGGGYPVSLHIVGALPVFGEVEPLVLDFFGDAAADKAVDHGIEDDSDADRQ